MNSAPNATTPPAPATNAANAAAIVPGQPANTAPAAPAPGAQAQNQTNNAFGNSPRPTMSAGTTNGAPAAPAPAGTALASTNSVVGGPAPVPAASTTNSAPVEPAAPPVPPTWHIQIVQLGTTTASDQELTVYTPYFVPPDSAVMPVAPQPPDPKLTAAQARTVVTIKGDNAQGSGFLYRTKDGPFVVTTLRLLAANPNIQVFTTQHTPITLLSLKGALDRDLAMFAIKDVQYDYLTSPTDLAVTAQLGDGVIIPGIGPNNELLLGSPGKLVGIGTGRIDFTNLIDADSAGDPIIHAKSGKVLAMVVPMKKIDLTDDLAAYWPGNPTAGSERLIPYFGRRLDDVHRWESYDPAKFLQETLFLKQFHHDTRCIDSYLNGKKQRGYGNPEEGPPDNRYYLNNDKLRAAQESNRQFAGGADRSQRIEGARELLASLETIVDTGVPALQAMKSPYLYDQIRIKEELAYRQALKKELDGYGADLPALDTIARAR